MLVGPEVAAGHAPRPPGPLQRTGKPVVVSRERRHRTTKLRPNIHRIPRRTQRQRVSAIEAMPYRAPFTIAIADTSIPFVSTSSLTNCVIKPLFGSRAKTAIALLFTDATYTVLCS